MNAFVTMTQCLGSQKYARYNTTTGLFCRWIMQEEK